MLFQIKDLELLLIKKEFVLPVNMLSLKETKLTEKREEQLLRLLDKHRSKTNKNDIIVPCSGKDGSWVAHQLKFKYGMNPLCVTWSPIVPTSLGKKI